MDRKTDLKRDPLDLLPARYAQAVDGLYVGNRGAARDLAFLSNADITAIVDISGFWVKFPLDPIEDVDVFTFLLPNQELMNTEFQKTEAKLGEITKLLQNLRSSRRTVLIVCDDGKNKCMLAAGHYLISGGAPYVKTIDQLEMLYFTQQQRDEELQERNLLATDPDIFEKRDKLDAKVREELALRASARRERACLTMETFKKLLRMRGGAKK
jgi:hypothetical protein